MVAKRTAAPRIFRLLLQAKDLARSRRFYESLLGVRGRLVGGGRVYFDCGPVILGLLDASGVAANERSIPTEALYLATEDLPGVFRRAQKLGCLSPELIHNDPENPAGAIVVRAWGERSFYATDPSGNPLCFVDASTLFTGTPTQVAALVRAFGGRPVHRSSGRPRSRGSSGTVGKVRRRAKHASATAGPGRSLLARGRCLLRPQEFGKGKEAAIQLGPGTGQGVGPDLALRDIDRDMADQAGRLQRAKRGGQGRRTHSREAPLDRAEPDGPILSEEGDDADRPLLAHDVDQPDGRARTFEIALRRLRHSVRT